MTHDHDHAPLDFSRAFAIGVGLNVLFVVIEGAYGVLADSLALVADAGHNLSDVAGLLLAWGAETLRRRPMTAHRTYGYHKTTILAALGSALLLLVAMGGVVWEGCRRLRVPEPPPGMTVIVVAGIGVVINTITALLFFSGRKKDLNIRGAFLHMAADAGISLGVVVAGILMIATQWARIDPVVSLAIAFVVVIGTWGLLRDSAILAIDAVPPGIDPARVRELLLSLDGVEDLHDLHIWGISTQDTALTVHLIMPNGPPGDSFLEQVANHLHDRFEIQHVTVQIETSATDRICCSLARPTSRT